MKTDNRKLHKELLNIFENARLKNKPLILDGSMGALLSQMGFFWDSRSWMTNVLDKSPETILSLHKEYIKAGADIITTHTFRSNPAAIGEKESTLWVIRAINLAKEAVENSRTIIAGSNPPAEDCYQVKRNLSKKELEINHYKHIDSLIDNGVDFILNETQSHLDEIEIICKYCAKNEIPFIISFYFNENLTLLSKESVSYVIDLVREHNPLTIGFNCMLPSVFSKIIKNYYFNFNWGFFLNCGVGAPTDKDIKCGISPKEYAIIAASYLDRNPSFIGACCGSSPEHIKKLKLEING